MPKSVQQFRSIVNSVKRDILNKSESYDVENTNDLQNRENLNGIVHRIHQFGSVINMIFNNVEHPMATKVSNHFKKNSLDLSNLSDEDKEACKHYVKIDIFMYPYDLNPGHINSVSKIDA